MFSISGYSRQTVKFLQGAEKIIAKRLLKRIEELKIKPIEHDTKSVEGYVERLFRVRVGDYRILYEIDHINKSIGIVKIDKRSRVYD